MLFIKHILRSIPLIAFSVFSQSGWFGRVKSLNRLPRIAFRGILGVGDLAAFGASCSAWRVSRLGEGMIRNYPAERWQAVDLPATGFIPVVLGILHYSKTLGIFVVQNPENH